MFALVYGINSSNSWQVAYDAFGVPLSFYVSSVQDWCMKTLQERPEWTTKAIIGKCLTFIIPHLTNYSHIIALGKALTSKTYTGKELLVMAYADTCIKFNLDVSFADPLMNECRKKDLDYKKLVVPICCQCILELKWDVFDLIKDALYEFSEVPECITGLGLSWNSSFSG